MSTSLIAAADSERRIVELFPIPTRQTFPPLRTAVTTVSEKKQLPAISCM